MWWAGTAALSSPAATRVPETESRAAQRGERLVHLVAVRGRVLVQDHDVRGQAFQAPELLGLQRLFHQWNVGLLDDADKENREVARDAVAPEPRLPEGVFREERGRRAQRAILEKDARGEPLIKLRLLWRNAQVAVGDQG